MVLECEPLNLVWATRHVERVGLAPVPCGNQYHLVNDYFTKRLAILQMTYFAPEACALYTVLISVSASFADKVTLTYEMEVNKSLKMFTNFYVFNKILVCKHL